MAIDQTMLDTTVATYKNWVTDFEEKGIENEHVQGLRTIVTEFETAAGQANDPNEFIQMTAELHSRAAQHYSALAAAKLGEPTAGSTSPDDIAVVFKLHIDDVKKQLAEAENDPERQYEIPTYKRRIEIFESGVTYPKYLQIAAEEDLDIKMIPAHAIKKFIAEGQENSGKYFSKSYIDMFDELMQTFEKLTAKHQGAIPHQVVWEVEDFRVRTAHWPNHVERNMRTKIMFYLLCHTHDWVDSFCKFAVDDPRWNTGGEALDVVMKRVIKTRECNPGMTKVYEGYLKEYFDIGWAEMFDNEVFKYEVMASNTYSMRMIFADERIEFLKQVRPHMKPGNEPPPELIAASEEMRTDLSRILRGVDPGDADIMLSTASLNAPSDNVERSLVAPEAMEDMDQQAEAAAAVPTKASSKGAAASVAGIAAVGAVSASGTGGMSALLQKGLSGGGFSGAAIGNKVMGGLAQKAKGAISGGGSKSAAAPDMSKAYDYRNNYKMDVRYNSIRVFWPCSVCGQEAYFGEMTKDSLPDGLESSLKSDKSMTSGHVKTSGMINQLVSWVIYTLLRPFTRMLPTPIAARIESKVREVAESAAGKATLSKSQKENAIETAWEQRPSHRFIAGDQIRCLECRGK
jgi:hypothetical protein